MHLKDKEGKDLVEQFAKGDLFVCKYTELRSFVWPNMDEDINRNIMVMEPEVLMGVNNLNQFIPLGIGFYFGKDGTCFEVFTP